MKINVQQLLAPVAALASTLGLVVACSETGPGAPPRTNGCIGQECDNIDGGTPGDSGPRPPADAGPDADAGFPDPLEGTTKIATLVTGGYRFTEGPVWIGGKLLFTDIPANTVRELLDDGGTSVFRNNSGGANGLAVHPGGDLLACEGSQKRVTRSAAQAGAARTPIAATFADAGFNQPNDVIVRADGNVYFTDPRYSGTQTQNDEAVYRVDPQGAVTRLAHDFAKPNGVALSPDGSTLYVVDNGTGKLLSAPVATDGAVGTFTELADVPGGDGMAVDDAGNLYVADDAGIDVFDATGKNKLGTIAVAVKPTNCTFGGANRRTLYITANGPQIDGGPQSPERPLPDRAQRAGVALIPRAHY